MGVCAVETNGSAGELVEIWSLDNGVAITSESRTQIVGNQKEYVVPLLLCGDRRKSLLKIWRLTHECDDDDEDQ